MTPRERALKIAEVVTAHKQEVGYWNIHTDSIADAITQTVEEACAEAIHAHLASVTPDGPVSEEKIQFIRDMMDTPVVDMADHVPDLLAAYDHFRSFAARLTHDSDAYAAGLEQGRRERAKVVEVLREVEWVGGSMHNTCPCCHATKGNEHGHFKDCKLAAALKESSS